MEVPCSVKEGVITTAVGYNGVPFTCIADEFIAHCGASVRAVLKNCLRVISLLKTTDHLAAGRVFKSYGDVCYRSQGLNIVGSGTTNNRYAIVWEKSLDDFSLQALDSSNPLPCNMFTFEELSIFTEYDLYHQCKNIKPGFVTANCGIIQAAPGCGKTHTIVESVTRIKKSSFLILVSTREGAVDVRRRLNEKGISVKVANKRVKTIDSYLMNDRSSTEALLIDEAMMQHPGKVIFSIWCAKARVVRLYGDVCQIPFVNRLPDYNVVYGETSKVFQILSMLNVSFRCPVDVCAILSHYYDSNAKTFGHARGMFAKSSRVLRSMTVQRISSVKVVPKGYDRYLTFKQSEAQELRILGFENVCTVHEFQGKEAKRVCLVRLSCIPKDEIYDRSQYQLTAISRHTEEFRYCTRLDTDILSGIIRTANLLTQSVLLSFVKRDDDYIIGGAIVYEDTTIVNPEPIEFTAVAMQREKVFVKKRNHSYVIVGKVHGRMFARNVYSGISYITVAAERAVSHQNLKDFLDLLQPSGDYTFVGKIFSNVHNANIVQECTRRGANRVYFMAAERDHISLEACQFMITNTLSQVANMGIQRNVVEYEILDPVAEYNSDLAILHIQQFIDALLPPQNNITDQTYDEYIFHVEDIDIPITGISMTLVGGLYKRPTFDKMRPVIRSTCYPPQTMTLRNALNALEKRNANVPKLMSTFSFTDELENIKTRFLGMFDNLCLDPIRPNGYDVNIWLNKQGQRVKDQLKAEVPVLTSNLSSYMFIIKPSPKPDLTADALSEYPRPQTILYQEKDVNAFFCPIWGCIRDRIIAGLKKHLVIFTTVSDSEFGDICSHRFPPSSCKNLIALEFDMKKFDKSQGELVLAFECWLLSLFGLPEDVIAGWYKAHAFTDCRVTNFHMKYKMEWQRKSGDAATFINNTLALMMFLLDVIPLEHIKFGMFAGDDSLLFVDPHAVEDLKLENLAYKYNLEAKLWRYNYHYFCSKFILPVGERWFVVPDPLKRAVKLGRADLRNPAFVEEYRMSFRDSVSVYRNINILPILNAAVNERYECCFDIIHAASALYAITDKSLFNDLYYSLPGDILNYDIEGMNVDL